MKKLIFNRREFLSAISLGTGYMMFGNPVVAYSRSIVSADPFQLVRLGNSGIKTTLLGMGTGVNGYQRSSQLTRQDKKISLNAFRHAYDLGIRMFDCADIYGTHSLMAETLRHIPRDEVTLVTKMWVFEGSGIPEAERPGADIVVERFLRELKTDYIDLVQLHCMMDAGWTDQYRWQMDLLENLKSKGIIRAHGVSVHSMGAMKAALASPWVDVIHVRVNPYGIRMDMPDAGEVIPVIQQLHDSGKGVIGMKMIGGGDYTGDGEKINETLRYVLGLKSVDMVVVGFETGSQIDNYAQRMKNVLAGMKNEVV